MLHICGGSYIVITIMINYCFLIFKPISLPYFQKHLDVSSGRGGEWLEAKKMFV